jgi:hypothetical protein
LACRRGRAIAVTARGEDEDEEADEDEEDGGCRERGELGLRSPAWATQGAPATADVLFMRVVAITAALIVGLALAAAVTSAVAWSTAEAHFRNCVNAAHQLPAPDTAVSECDELEPGGVA